MKVQRLIEKYKKLEGVWNAEGAELARQIFLQDLEQLDESETVTIPQFVADAIEGAREQNVELEDAFEYVWEVATGELRKWFGKLENRNNFARAWLDGYEVEEEKKYKITLLNRNDGHLYLVNQNANLADKYGHFSPVVLLFTKSTNFSEKCYKLTKKDVVANDFGWVFDCPGIKIEEVDLCH